MIKGADICGSAMSSLSSRCGSVRDSQHDSDGFGNGTQNSRPESVQVGRPTWQNMPRKTRKRIRKRIFGFEIGGERDHNGGSLVQLRRDSDGGMATARCQR
jgi:hypothetical protein